MTDTTTTTTTKRSSPRAFVVIDCEDRFMHVAQVQLGAFQTKLTLCANYEAYFGQGTKLTVLGE